MVEHSLGMRAIVVRFYVGAPCPLTLIGSADSLKRSWMSVRIRQGVPKNTISKKQWKCGRVWFIATVLKTVVSKGTVSSNLTVSAKFCLCVYGYPYVSSELTKSLITVPEARSKSGSMPDSAHALDSM